MRVCRRAAGICGGIYPVPTPKPSSPGVCMRGPGGPCTFVATADGITGGRMHAWIHACRGSVTLAPAAGAGAETVCACAGSFTGDHSASDSACSSFDPEFC